MFNRNYCGIVVTHVLMDLINYVHGVGHKNSSFTVFDLLIREYTHPVCVNMVIRSFLEWILADGFRLRI